MKFKIFDKIFNQLISFQIFQVFLCYCLIQIYLIKKLWIGKKNVFDRKFKVMMEVQDFEQLFLILNLIQIKHSISFDSFPTGSSEMYPMSSATFGNVLSSTLDVFDKVEWHV